MVKIIALKSPWMLSLVRVHCLFCVMTKLFCKQKPGVISSEMNWKKTLLIPAAVEFCPPTNFIPG